MRSSTQCNLYAIISADCTEWKYPLDYPLYFYLKTCRLKLAHKPRISNLCPAMHFLFNLEPWLYVCFYSEFIVTKREEGRPIITPWIITEGQFNFQQNGGGCSIKAGIILSQRLLNELDVMDFFAINLYTAMRLGCLKFGHKDCHSKQQLCVRPSGLFSL